MLSPRVTKIEGAQKTRIERKRKEIGRESRRKRERERDKTHGREVERVADPEADPV